MAGRIVLEPLSNGIVQLTISNPKRLNAMTVAMWGEFERYWRQLSADDSVRCVILTGDGDRALCVGADISEFEESRSDKPKARDFKRRVIAALEAFAQCPHPIVAAIRGLCVGGGLEMSCYADVRIAGAGSKFGIPIKRMGLTIGYDEIKLLLPIIGPAFTKEILIEGKIHDSADALRMGLVNRIVPDDQVMAEAIATAERIAEGAPLAARWHKKFIDRMADPRPLTPEEHDEEFDCFDTEDFQIGFRAFLAKEKPVFTGR